MQRVPRVSKYYGCETYIKMPPHCLLVFIMLHHMGTVYAIAGVNVCMAQHAHVLLEE